jgi:GNAT superfamily N-acetyltransferase
METTKQGRQRQVVVIRRARPEEAETLSGLMRRSKAHWGYDQAFMEVNQALLTITAEAIKRDTVYIAEVGDRVAGMSHLAQLEGDEALLDDLFVEPEHIGTGVGAALWRHAAGLAREWGARAIVLDADPNARPFYERMGAVITGETASTTMPGRTMPRMRYELGDD